MGRFSGLKLDYHSRRRQWGRRNDDVSFNNGHGWGHNTCYIWSVFLCLRNHRIIIISDLTCGNRVATSFVPIFSAPDSYDVTMQQNSNDPQDWKSGQNWTSSGGDFSAQTFTIEVSCQGDCDDDFIFEGAWVETELAPEG